MKHVFIINPTSGRGQYKEAEQIIKNYFKQDVESYAIRYTEYIGHAKQIAKEYTEQGIRLYSVGGDGTAHEILNGMHFTSELAIIPVGTGNDFWKMVELGHEHLETLIPAIIDGDVKTIDIGKANEHYFINCLNVGVDTEVNKRVNSSRQTIVPRKMMYIYHAIGALMGHRETSLTITVNGETKEYNTILTSVMNGKWYGGGFKSAPNASITDGLLDVNIIENVPALQLPRLVPKYYKGEHLGLDVVNDYQTKSLRIQSTTPFPVGIDGEVIETCDIFVEVCEQKLSFVFPKVH